MSSHKYDWKHGPAEIQQHSIAKHQVLQAYLAAYFQTLAPSPSQDVMRLTLVDGFAGGGLYHHADTGDLVKGSPFILLQAAKEAEFFLNQGRRKPLKLEVDFFFVEAQRSAFLHLDKVLQQEGVKGRIGTDIHMQRGKFEKAAPNIIEFIRKKSPRNGRSIFVLDQYGYKDVPMPLIRNIFSQLPTAEIILTFGVDSFSNFASDSDLTRLLMNRIGLPDVLQGLSFSEIKASGPHWRLLLQSRLYKGLVESCGAAHYTPFFIRNRHGHGDYWLLHLSQHPRARDVMTEVHWQHNNYFIHYGGAGLDMFHMVGYDPTHDSKHKQQENLGFGFDDVARKFSISTLSEDIPHRIYATDSGLTFTELFAGTCNHSPASARIYRESLDRLLEEKIVEVISEKGTVRRSASQVKGSDRIRAPQQRQILFT